MSIDRCLHSLFGASKVAADVLVQEYGRYFGMRTACFRGGTLTGPRHSAAELHGFLAYVMRCAMTGTPYTVYGYKGKQVRDAIHSLDLIRAFHAFFREPRVAEVYNIGGGRFSNASVLEAISLSEEIAGETLDWTYRDENRVGDHIWWIGDNGRFESHYPDWKLEYDVRRILEEIHEAERRPLDAGPGLGRALRLLPYRHELAVDPLARERIGLRRVVGGDPGGAAHGELLPGGAVALERLALPSQRRARPARQLAHRPRRPRTRRARRWRTRSPGCQPTSPRARRFRRAPAIATASGRPGPGSATGSPRLGRGCRRRSRWASCAPPPPPRPPTGPGRRG